ncbi:ankyrin repeat domain-containing protein 63 [Elysia marginata]|uniref:Ankyrin repeat domain-containing protein 63 n=1 Tax=Elysia marginata TaxID=1093978 RepID=A0AAV4ECJ3_9GAST|nr:ankyrin repeat domain-containing protein 63 [Elysia marginata]
MVRILKEAGAAVNMPDKEGRTPLIHACEKRCNDIVRILIQHCNISPDITDQDGNTALIHAAFIGNDIALEILVRHFRRLGLQIDHYNQAGYTALHIAAKSGFLLCAKILAVKGKASLTIKDKVHGLTPLDWSLKEGYQKSEVEFLKPSAKFYRLAKLTTTMVKYRKRSSVTSQESLPQIADSAKPVKTVDKAKGKVKHLLKKTPQSQDDSEFMAIGAGCVPKQPKSSGMSKAQLTKAAGVEFSKAKTAAKKSRSKATRQRSLTLTGTKDVVTASKQKASLKHSISHPCPGKSDMGETGVGNCQENCRTTNVSQALALYKDAILHDEFGAEIDTEDESSCSDTETISFIESLKKSPTFDIHGRKSGSISCGGVYCGEIVSSSEDADRSSYGIPSLSQYTDGGVYCGDIKSQDLKGFTTSPDTSSIQNKTCSNQNYQQDSSSKRKTDSKSEAKSIDIQSLETLETFPHNSLGHPIKDQHIDTDTSVTEKTDNYSVILKTKTGRRNDICPESSEGSEESIFSPSTTIEVLGNIGQSEKMLPFLDENEKSEISGYRAYSAPKHSNSLSLESEDLVLDSESTHLTELPETGGGGSGSKLSNRQIKSCNAQSQHESQVKSCSTDTSTTDMSSCTETTLVGGTSTNLPKRNDNTFSTSISLTNERTVESSTDESRQCISSNTSSDTTCIEYLKSTSYTECYTKSGTYGKALHKDPKNSVDIDDAFETNDYEMDEDPETVQTFLADHHPQKKNNTRKPLHHSTNLISSPVRQDTTQEFKSEITAGKEKIKKLNKSDHEQEAELFSLSDKQVADASGKIGYLAFGGEQKSTLNAKIKSLRITSDNTGESHCDSTLTPLSQNGNTKSVESRHVNIYSKGQHKGRDEQSSTNIGQFSRGNGHIESVT